MVLLKAHPDFDFSNFMYKYWIKIDFTCLKCVHSSLGTNEVGIDSLASVSLVGERGDNMNIDTLNRTKRDTSFNATQAWNDFSEGIAIGLFI